MSELKTLQAIAKDFSVLYAEDNEALRLNASRLLNNFFGNVLVARDGQEAFEIFKQNKIDILISDIKMPHMDGLELTEKVRLLEPKLKVIIMSAFDDKEHLMRAINSGVFSFLKKPVNVTDLTQTLQKAVLEIKKEQTSELFFMHLKSIFNYQSSMIIMLDEKEPILANQFFLEFFDLKDIDEFNQKYKNLGLEFLEHDGFLYNHGEIDWFDVLELNEKKLFHVKMKNIDKEIRHFILKYQSIPEKEGYSILSFDDVTELNLLKLFDEKQTKSDEKVQDTRAMFDLLEVLQRNSAQISVHNYYKGLNITNNAIISHVGETSISIKTTYMQLKAVQFEQKTILTSEALPFPVECSAVNKIGFEKQEAELQDLRFIKTSPTQRKSVRVVPDERHTVSLFIGENKFHGDVKIEDLSLDGIKLSLNALPAGLQSGDEVTLDIVLEIDKRPVIIKSKAIMTRKSESRYNFSVVFMFVEAQKSNLVKYIAKRQMAIIREFKGLLNG